MNSLNTSSDLLKQIYLVTMFLVNWYKSYITDLQQVEIFP